MIGRLTAGYARGRDARVGFTVLELIVVLVLVAVLLLLLAPAGSIARPPSQLDAVEAACRSAVAAGRVTTATVVGRDSIASVACYPSGLRVRFVDPVGGRS